MYILYIYIYILLLYSSMMKLDSYLSMGMFPKIAIGVFLFFLL